MTRPKATPSKKRSTASKSRGTPDTPGFAIVIESPHTFLPSRHVTRKARRAPKPAARPQGDSVPRREDHDGQATKRRQRNSEQEPDVQSQPPPKKRPRKRETEEHQDVPQTLTESPALDALASKVHLLPGLEPRVSASGSSEDIPLSSCLPSSSGGGHGVATATAGRGRKAATGWPRGYPHVTGSYSFSPSSHSLARGLVPLTKALLAACGYDDEEGFQPPCGHVSPSPSPSPDIDRSPLIVEPAPLIAEPTPLILAPTPWYSYNMRPQWLVDSPPADSVAPLLEALTPRTVSRIFDEADPRAVDRFVQLCRLIHDQCLLPDPLPPTFTSLGGHPYGGVFEDSRASCTSYFPGGIRDSRPVPLLSSSMSAAYKSLGDLSGLDWITPPALPLTFGWTPPRSFYFDPPAAPEMAFTYQGSWSAPQGSAFAPTARGADLPMPPQPGFSPRSEAAVILAELASGKARSHAATRMNMRQAIAPSRNDMPRLSISESSAERRQSRQVESGLAHWLLPPSCEGQFGGTTSSCWRGR
ncbi:uncharacterized protein TRAVEDRAFT_23205 [Trametes versicolor FP-101664 SS1]|uniref:uncharacterized protein n=1 Tax=Trametes versicolor (strain FP-101664) TaxID=717944 RepID=UPI0004624669|nr:uncharacterized protein TRAVEDRAFT_23205 [Trametes versicolor FP-101664 SS1]EIW53952.1 hypothetical protein TRAVEDRAFT_23205 [Trametes versicolor FP-101664 SS1]